MVPYLIERSDFWDCQVVRDYARMNSDQTELVSQQNDAVTPGQKPRPAQAQKQISLGKYLQISLTPLI